MIKVYKDYFKTPTSMKEKVTKEEFMQFIKNSSSEEIPISQIKHFPLKNDIRIKNSQER